MAKSVKSPDGTDAGVGEKIRTQRLVRGISQTDLGNKVGITFQQIQKYEKGVNRVGAGRLQRIADASGAADKSHRKSRVALSQRDQCQYL